MIKKTILITAFTALIGLVIWGGINRTIAKSETESTNQTGQTHGATFSDQTIQAQGSETSRQGMQPRGSQGGSQSAASAEDTYHNYGGQSQGAGQPGASAGEDHPGQAGAGDALPAADPAGLTSAEAASLLFMREEEKLAHDVYLVLFDLWGLPVFQNIAASEQTHTDAIKTLLDRYGLTDPVSGLPGVFADPALQTLYTQLIAQGSISLPDALKVGAAIEEIDILDLQERLSQTDQTDIQQVYTSLLSGSENHLRSFTSLYLAQTGAAYEPQYLSLEAYQLILASSGTGSSQGGGRGNGGRGHSSAQP